MDQRTRHARVRYQHDGRLAQGRRLGKEFLDQAQRTYDKLKSKLDQQPVGNQWLKGIGSGAFGKVYLMRKLNHQTGVSKLYAIKTIPKGKSLVEMSTDERRILSILMVNAHRNIVGYFGWFVSSNRRLFEGVPHNCFAFEYVDGGDLVDKMTASRNRIPESTCAFIVMQVLKGLRHLQRFRIIHRDIKPANILLTRNNIAKITDFGLSTRLPRGKTEIQQIWSGTPCFIPPEGWSGRLGYKFDSFSVGVMVYVLSNRGFHPFEQLPIEVYHAQLKAIQPALFRNQEANKDIIAEQAKQLFLSDISTRITRNRQNWYHFLKNREYSIEMREFADRLLEKNQYKRLSVSEALKDPWILRWNIGPTRLLRPET